MRRFEIFSIRRWEVVHLFPQFSKCVLRQLEKKWAFIINLYWLWKISLSQDIVSVVANCWGSFHLSVIVLFSSSVFKLWQIEEGGKNADMEQASDVLQSQHKGSPLPPFISFLTP